MPSVIPDFGELDLIAISWISAKASEDKAREKRIKAEEDLIAALENADEKFAAKDEGSKIFNFEQLGTTLKFTLSKKLTRKLDVDAYSGAKHKVKMIGGEIQELTVEQMLADNYDGVVEYKPKLSDAGAKWLKEHEPELYKYLATCITEKPAKVGVKVIREIEGG